MELFEVIADALRPRATSYQHGRSNEGVSLLNTWTARRAGGRPHRDGGALDHGLSNSLATRDVLATWELEVEGDRLARRTGRRDLR